MIRVWIEVVSTIHSDDQLVHVDEGIFIHIEGDTHLKIPLDEAIGLDDKIISALNRADRFRREVP